MFKLLGRLYQRFPLTVRSVAIGLVMALGASLLLDLLHTSMLDKAFERELSRRLEHEVAHSHMMFDEYLQRYRQTARLLATHEPLVRYLEKGKTRGDTFQIRNNRPVWLPPLVSWLILAQPAHVLLLDREFSPQEVYHLREDESAAALIEDEALWRDMGEDAQHRIIEHQGRLFLVAEAPVEGKQGRVGSLVLIAPVDDAFLQASQLNMPGGETLLALVQRDQGRIIASSEPQNLLPGTYTQDLHEQYLMADRGLFRYGETELPLQFVTLIKREQVTLLNAEAASVVRQQRFIMATVLVVLFGLLLFFVLRRVDRLVKNVAEFSQEAFGVTHFSDPHGDPICQLEQKIFLLTREVISSREQMQTKHRKSKREGEVSLLQAVTEGLGVGVFLNYRHGPRPINPQMETIRRRFGIEPFLIPEMGCSERALCDDDGSEHIFQIHRLEGVAHVDIYLVKDITESRIKTALLEYQASHDELTRLPNRAMLVGHLQSGIDRAQEDGHILALIILDLDGFKEINDTLGHPAGDAILQQIAQRIPDQLGSEQLFGRLGGDEFAIVLPDTQVEEAVHAAEAVQKMLETPFELDSQRLMISASFGIAFYPEHGKDADEILQRADVAMYLAKQRRRGFTIYDPELDPHSRERLQLMGEMKQAISEGQMQLHYQPQLTVESHQVISVEALVRWYHPQQGEISPGLFVPMAEQTGQIGLLTQWVLEESVRQLSEWQAQGVDARISLNLSAHDLMDSALVETIAELLGRYQVPGDRLGLEITESAMMGDPERAEGLLLRLARMNIWLSIDDFGTGYSSMSYLKRLPVHEIKIDQSFVQGMLQDEQDAIIVRSMVDLAHNLGLKVVAEGVEDYDTWEVLACLGCDKVQGYYIGRPFKAEGLLDGAMIGSAGSSNDLATLIMLNNPSSRTN